MSTKSGSVPLLKLPTPPHDANNQDAMNNWIFQVQFAIQAWADNLITKIKEMESLSINGQGLNLPTYAPDAIVEKRDGVIVMFANDPNNAGGGFGLYRYNASTTKWEKV